MALQDMAILTDRQEIKGELALLCSSFIVNPLLFIKPGYYLTFSLTGGAGGAGAPGYLLVEW